MKLIHLLAVASLLPSCALYRAVTENNAKVTEGIKLTVDTIADAKAKYDKITEVVNTVSDKVTALNKDQDGDGDVDLTDLLMGLGILGGAGGAAGAARAKLSNAKKDSERERARIAEANLDKRLALLESKG